ncbi:MAG: DUF2239 family protein [Sandaracinus sp.]
METTTGQSTWVAFRGARRVASGTRREVLATLKSRFDADPSEQVLVFDDDSGAQIALDLRGTLDEVLEREDPLPRTGPGRPRLGVTSREVSLLPRHWDWLAEQPSGASAALRRLVEQAMKAAPEKERARRIRAALSRFLTAMAGDRPHYEEACRALFAGETARFEELVARWPRDVREHAVARAREASRADRAAER